MTKKAENNDKFSHSKSGKSKSKRGIRAALIDRVLTGVLAILVYFFNGAPFSEKLALSSGLLAYSVCFGHVKHAFE